LDWIKDESHYGFPEYKAPDGDPLNSITRQKLPVRRIIILGAGLAGLAAACRLSETPGMEIVILEKEKTPGGLATSISFQGHRGDLGPHRIHTEIAGVQNLLHQYANDLLISRPRASRMMLDGHFLAYPPTLGGALRHFGPFGLVRFAASYLGALLRGGLSSSCRTFEEAMTASFGAALYRAIVKPYAEKTWGMPASQISADVAGARVSAGGLGALARRLIMPEKKGRETSLSEFLYIRGGIGRLPLHLAKILRKRGVIIQSSRSVTGLKALPDGGWEVSWKEPGAHGNLSADACLSTIPVTDLVRFLGASRPDPGLEQTMAGLHYLSMILVFVRLKRPSVGPDSWLYFPDPTLIFNRACEFRNFDPELSPAGETMLCLEITSLPHDPEWNRPDGYFVREACRDLGKTGLVRQEEILGTTVRRITHAYPVYTTSYRDRLQDVFAFLRNSPALLSFGRQGLFHHNNMDHSIYEGILAAECMMEHGSEAPRFWYAASEQFRRLRIVD